MKSWWEQLLELIFLIPIKLVEFILNIFAFIIYAIWAPIIKIVKLIVGANSKNTTKDDKS